MIYDSLSNIHFYKNLPQPLVKALEFAAQAQFSLADGTYEIDGRDVFAIVSSYQTHAPNETSFEGHQKYIDLQVVLTGRESLNIAPTENLPVAQPYSEEKDLVFFQNPETYSTVILEPSLFVVLYPHEAHQPGCHLNNIPSPIRKLVVKIKT